MANCVNHAIRPAITNCRKCSKPICDQCSQTFGRFCSAGCQSDFKDVQSRITDAPLGRRKRFSMLGCLKTFIISIVLSVVIWIALTQLLRTSDPAQMLVELKRMWRVAF